MTESIPPADGDQPDGVTETFSQLHEALTRANLVFPSLAVDPHSVLNSRLIELGRVNLPTARKLAAVLTRGAER